jgi:hypothetical protein
MRGTLHGGDGGVDSSGEGNEPGLVWSGLVWSSLVWSGMGRYRTVWGGVGRCQVWLAVCGAAAWT